MQKFFGTIRGAAGTNEHPTSPTFLVLYKLLSVYSLIKPPLYGNCIVTEIDNETVIKLSDIKKIYRPSESKTEAALKQLKNKIDVIITNNEWEADEVFEHDYASSEILDCIIYYVTGFSIYIFFPQYCIVLNTHVF